MKTLKTYKSDTYGSMCLSLNVNGVRRSVQFGGGSRYLEAHSTFSTCETKLQKAIESSEAFNRHVFLVSESKVFDANDKIREDLKYKDIKFSSVKECQEYFAEHYGPQGFKSWTINSQKKCIEAGLEYGLKISFEKPTEEEEDE